MSTDTTTATRTTAAPTFPVYRPGRPLEHIAGDLLAVQFNTIKRVVDPEHTLPWHAAYCPETLGPEHDAELTRTATDSEATVASVFYRGAQGGWYRLPDGSWTRYLYA